MIKNSVIALVAAATLASGFALPAMAASSSTSSSENGIHEFDDDYVLYQLQEKGVDATAVEEWGSYLRAYVVDADGRQVMQFFDPDTLAPANI